MKQRREQNKLLGKVVVDTRISDDDDAETARGRGSRVS